jgi:hypothetical protein
MICICLAPSWQNISLMGLLKNICAEAYVESAMVVDNLTSRGFDDYRVRSYTNQEREVHTSNLQTLHFSLTCCCCLRLVYDAVAQQASALKPLTPWEPGREDTCITTSFYVITVALWAWPDAGLLPEAGGFRQRLLLRTTVDFFFRSTFTRNNYSHHLLRHVSSYPCVIHLFMLSFCVRGLHLHLHSSRGVRGASEFLVWPLPSIHRC